MFFVEAIGYLYNKFHKPFQTAAEMVSFCFVTQTIYKSTYQLLLLLSIVCFFTHVFSSLVLCGSIQLSSSDNSLLPETVSEELTYSKANNKSKGTRDTVRVMEGKNKS